MRKPMSNPRITLRVGDVIQSTGNLPQVIKERKDSDDGWALTDGCGLADWVFDTDDHWQRIYPS